jgi:hypothetical protein
LIKKPFKPEALLKWLEKQENIVKGEVKEAEKYIENNGASNWEMIDTLCKKNSELCFYQSVLSKISQK